MPIPPPAPPAADRAASLHGPGHALEAIEHVVEDAVEHALVATERSLAQRFGAGCVRGFRRALKWTLIALLIVYFGFGALFLATRYLVMPNVDQARPWLERELSRAVDAQLTIGRIDAGWRGFNPHLSLRDLRLTSRRGDAHLALPQVDAVLSWGSVPRLSLHFASLSVLAPELEVRRTGAQRFTIAGFAFDAAAGNTGERHAPLLDWLLDQTRISIRDARVVCVDDAGATDTDAAPTYTFSDVQLTLLGGLTSTRLSLQARPPGELAGTLDVRGDFRHGWLKRPSDLAAWKGRLFVKLDSADLARTEAVARLLPASMRIEQAQGAVRAWADIDHLELTQLTADVILRDVRAVTGAELAPLQVSLLQGRLTQRQWGDASRGGQELQLQGFTLHGDNLDLPPTDLRYRYTRGTAGDGSRGTARAPRTELEASRLSLDMLTHLAAHVPLARALQERIARQAVGGTLTQLRIDLDGEPTAPDRYTVQSRFDKLSMSAQPAEPLLDDHGHPRAGLPGFSNLSGSLDLTESGGTVTIDARDATLDLPGVLAQPLTLERLDLRTRITRGDGHVDLQVQSLAAISDDFDVSASGTYRGGTAADSGPGTIDLTARVNTLAVAAAPRLVPLQAGPQTRAWLTQALAGGRASEGSIRLRGDLRDFPFRQRERGEFRVAIGVRGAVLDYLPAAVRSDGSTRPAWPRIDDIDADVVFDRQALTVTSRRARIFGSRLNPTVARIDDLYQGDPTLSVRGSAGGSAADMLRYVNQSGLREPLSFLNPATANGAARLELKLDIPLAHAHRTQVAGTVHLADNDIALGGAIPALAQVSGRIDFTQSTVRFTDMRAGLAGGQVSANGGTRGDGAIELTGSGTATPAAVARLVDVGPVQRLLARSRGLARYNAKLLLHDHQSDLQVDSDLAGWSIDAPAPLGKAAAAALPVRIELTGLGADREQVMVDAGNALRVRLDLARADGRSPMKVERGVVALGEPAPLPARGLLAHVNLPHVDAQAWQSLLENVDATGAGASPTASATDAPLDTLNLRTRELLIAGKSVANVSLRARRVADSGEAVWLADIHSDEVQGSLNWRPGQEAGRLSARLTRLAIPESQRVQVAQLLDAPPTSVPGFDVIADNFELGGRQLGRLELAATNGGTAAQPVWNVDKLEIASPDGHLHASGRWQREVGQTQRTMTLLFGLDFANGGALLHRLGVPDALRDGQGRIEGELNWRGSPFAIHYPSLTGNLKLKTSTGQFLKANAGAGRLLGVLSLQSLPRRMTLDFRDVFAEGFAFDSITATAQVKAGVLTTHDFRMAGAAAKVLIEGSADIGRETQNLHVLVLPEVNAGSASLAYALFANPAIGLGTFLAQLVLREPLSKAFSFEYDVTGTWADPQVKRRERPVVESAAGGN